MAIFFGRQEGGVRGVPRGRMAWRGLSTEPSRVESAGRCIGASGGMAHCPAGLARGEFGGSAFTSGPACIVVQQNLRKCVYDTESIDSAHRCRVEVAKFQYFESLAHSSVN
jgi:hypothetical protein